MNQHKSKKPYAKGISGDCGTSVNDTKDIKNSLDLSAGLSDIWEPLKIRIFEGEAGYICIFVCIETSHFCLIGQKWLVLFTLGLLLPAFQALFLILGMVIPCTSLLILFFAFQ